MRAVRSRACCSGPAPPPARSVLNFLVLLFGGKEDWSTLAKLVLLAHVPVVMIEGLMLGVIVRYLEKVKPEMLSSKLPDHSGKISSNGISH